MLMHVMVVMAEMEESVTMAELVETAEMVESELKDAAVLYCMNVKRDEPEEMVVMAEPEEVDIKSSVMVEKAVPVVKAGIQAPQ